MSSRSQFFHSHLSLSSQAKLRSTIQRLGVHHFERVQFAALGDLHCHMPTQDFLHTSREGLAHIAAIGEQALHPAQVGFAARERQQCSLAIRHLGRHHRHRVRQPLRIHRDVALDARDFLACVIALQGRRVGVLHTLRVDDQERA